MASHQILQRCKIVIDRKTYTIELDDRYTGTRIKLLQITRDSFFPIIEMGLFPMAENILLSTTIGSIEPKILQVETFSGTDHLDKKTHK